MRRTTRPISRWFPLVLLAILGSACSGSLDEFDSANEVTAKATSTTEGPLATNVASGIAVPSNRFATLQQVEADTGTAFSVVRVFARWDTRFPDAEHQAILDSGHRMHFSIRPRTDAGQNIMWRDMAAATPGSALYREMEAWADDIIAIGAGTYFTLNHEPETTDSAANGIATEYVAAWRAFTDILRDRGGSEILMTYTMTAGAFTDGRAELWYPGDEYVDVVGTDAYNWFTCQGSDRPWRSFDEVVRPGVDFANEHGKTAAVPEFASVEDPLDPTRRAAWIDATAETLASDYYRDTVEFVAWFNVVAPGGTWPNCVWSYDLTAESAKAFSELMGALS